MELSETIADMVSGDYSKRFVAEYDQVCIRMNRLNGLLDAWDAGKLDFEPECPRDMLNNQYAAYNRLRLILEQRAEIEGIELPPMDHWLYD